MNWQPIDTAPKDRDVLLYWPRYAYSLGDQPRRVIAIGRWVIGRKGVGYFHDTDEYDDYALAEPEHAPTHWLPLPNQPD